MKAFMIYWEDGTTAFTLADSKDQAEYNFDVVADPSFNKILEVDLSGIVVDFQKDGSSIVHTDLVEDESFTDKLCVIESLLGHQDRHSTTP